MSNEYLLDTRHMGGSALSDLDEFVLLIFDLVGILILNLYTRQVRSSEAT